MSRNIKYATKKIKDYYGKNRIAWEQFYESERVIISSIGLNSKSKVLDIGCGCGGLGLALYERFGVTEYTGIEINAEASVAARQMNPRAKIINGDILEIPARALKTESFDAVFSLGCIDWNVQFDGMLARAFTYVKARGCFVSSFRLTDKKSINDMSKAYQYINFDGEKKGEKAAYVILNFRSLMKTLEKLQPDEIRGYGYWGAPSKTAVVPYDRLCFAVFAVRKSKSETKKIKLNLELPDDIIARGKVL